MKVKNAVIIELKQWSQCTLTEFDSDKVVTWVGGGNKHVLHPSIQAGNYKYYLQDNNSAFYDETDPIHLMHAVSSTTIILKKQIQSSTDVSNQP